MPVLTRAKRRAAAATVEPPPRVVFLVKPPRPDTADAVVESAFAEKTVLALLLTFIIWATLHTTIVDSLECHVWPRAFLAGVAGQMLVVGIALGVSEFVDD
jgi:hypothetical protein